jgi:hypothetical protein
LVPKKPKLKKRKNKMETKQTKINGNKFLHNNFDKTMEGQITEIRKVDIKYTRYGYINVYMIFLDVIGIEGNIYEIGLQYWSKKEVLNFKKGEIVNFVVTYKPSYSRNSSDYHFDTVQQAIENINLNK